VYAFRLRRRTPPRYTDPRDGALSPVTLGPALLLVVLACLVSLMGELVPERGQEGGAMEDSWISAIAHSVASVATAFAVATAAALG
jgi:hypothetical protein